MYALDLPHETPTRDGEAAVLAYCGVLSVECSKCSDFPTLFDGIRFIKFRLERDIPYFSSIGGFECHVWYREQPVQCFMMLVIVPSTVLSLVFAGAAISQVKGTGSV